MAYRLPPLNALRAFESAGRYLSFTRAANELHVTQAAVSHQIKSLETWLGMALFKRLNRAIILTESGQHYLLWVRDALDGLEAATKQILTASAGTALTISVMPSFGATWLVRRMARFAQLHPEIGLRISADDRTVDFAREDVDVAVRYGRGAWPGLHATRLMRQNIFPVCSPALVHEGPHPLRSPDDLRHHILLQEDSTTYDWRMWLLAAGVDDIDPARGPSFSHAHVLYQAAIVGQGVAIGATPMVDDDLAAGRLVKPFELTIPIDWAFYVVCAEKRQDEPNIVALRNWLLAEAAVEGNEPLQPPGKSVP